MNINRHNYEEFFILYWDNELTADEKKQVEVFVQENADLKEEFRLYGDTRFTPDTNILFEEKEFLLNEKGSLVNYSNYSAQLLSYIDNELTTDEKNEFEKFAEKHPAIQQELALLLKTKLQPEAEIIFPDKSILYRKEEKVRIISFNWKRLAVAAIILLMAGIITIRIINNNKKDGKPELVKIISPKENKEDQLTSKTDLAKQDQKQTGTKPTENKKTKRPVFENLAAENNVALIKEENKNNLPKEKNGAAQILATNNIETNVPESINYPEIKKATNDAVAVANNEKKEDLFNNATVTKTSAPAFAIYNPANEDKGGIKGFLRKATRVFEHRTNIKTTTDDNKLLVGVFAVSLK